MSDRTDARAVFGDFRPEVALVLGSGLGSFAQERVAAEVAVPYAAIPGFPRSTVDGHAGRFVGGRAAGRRVLCMQGRFHGYEGYSLAEVTSGVRLMAAAGARIVVLTNAAGGIRADLAPGDLMLIEDHINGMGGNPLIGPEPIGETRFPDMSAVYDAELREAARRAAAHAGVDLKEGVYWATTGPSYETPAEIRAFARLGADAVGMSTVPEAIVARALGLRVAGVSCITNAAAGREGGALSHEEVAAAAHRSRAAFSGLLEGVLARLPDDEAG